MKSNELRIGNWVLWDSIEAQIDAQDILSISKNEQEVFYAPIPLTEEWLIRFGFEERQLSFSKRLNDYTEIKLSMCNDMGKGEYYAFIKQREDMISTPQRMFYVHQLQNLFFALTGEELKTKE